MLEILFISTLEPSTVSCNVRVFIWPHFVDFLLFLLVLKSTLFFRISSGRQNHVHLKVYEYCSNGTLYDALHGDDERRIKLSWNARIRVALGAARALEYLHENFRPPIVHRNFKSANVLLNDKLEVCVSDCGLGPLLSSGSAGQLSGRLLTAYGYSAPEFEAGSYTQQSDVFSFGVVMLELLTGRKSYDNVLCMMKESCFRPYESDRFGEKKDQIKGTRSNNSPSGSNSHSNGGTQSENAVQLWDATSAGNNHTPKVALPNFLNTFHFLK
ncbi:hypothetical protein RIF29_30375 [Crotalaria pallida]|uniref:Protein kinase domain-containing protein n=1 Tax=Crotalaria pallida TaxID=3830 RepID=A0AAN9EGJ5_CROPI